jgi:hypothetical protein
LPCPPAANHKVVSALMTQDLLHRWGLPRFFATARVGQSCFSRLIVEDKIRAFEQMIRGLDAE